MNRNEAWHKYVWVLVISTFLVSCAGTPVSQAPSTTDMLLQSGFRAEPAQSPDHIQKLPGNQFVTLQRQGQTVYVYTDPSTKQLYFGSEAAYQRYLSMAAAKAAESKPAPASSQSDMSSLDWTMYRSLHGVGP